VGGLGRFLGHFFERGDMAGARDVAYQAFVEAQAAAERGFLEGLGGGCAAPIAAHAVTERRAGADWLRVRGLVASLDGRRVVRVEASGPPAGARMIGLKLAADARTRGAGALIP